ncbi:MAG TPA: WD40 repeat domain-containing protein, partial [Nocardioides sp.]|nr:WD40 repeat domain-containing protein [Nocardioides sp.]
AADVPPAHRAILDDLVDARLVVVNEVNDQQVYAPAHESLFSAWPPLVQLIEHRHDDLVLRGRLERRAADWREGGATQSGLLSGLELDQARDWRTRNQALSTADVTAYVDASTARQSRGRMIRTGVAVVVAALAVSLVVVLLVNARADRARADDARLGELAAIAQRELVHDPAAAAAALLRGLEQDPDAGEIKQLARTLLRSPARDVYRASGQATFFQLAVGGPMGTVTTGDDTLVWDTDRATVRSFKQAGAQAVRPDGRVYVAADAAAGVDVYDLGTDGDRPTPLALFSTNDQSVPVFSFSPDGSLLAEGRRSWVALWDMRNPAEPRRLATWHSNVGDPTALAVLDDGRVLVGSKNVELAVWNALGDGSAATLVPGSTDAGVQHLIADATGRTALIDYPAFDPIKVVDVETGSTISSYSAMDPGAGQGTLPPISWASSMSPDGTTVASFDLAGRGYVFDTTDGHLLTTLTGGHTSLVSEAFFNQAGLLLTASVDGSLRLWDPRATTTDVSGSLTDDLCREFGNHIDADSWRLAFDDEKLDPPCPAAARSAPPPLEVSSSANVGAVPEVSTPRTVAFRDTFDDGSSFRVGKQQLQSGTLTTSIKNGRYRVEVNGVGDGYTAKQFVPASGAGDTWAVVADQGRTRGQCGLYAADGSSQVAVTLDRDAGTGTMTWFSLVGSTHEEPFSVPAGLAEDLALVDDHGVVAVLVGGRRVVTVDDPVLKPPTTVGVATHGDTASCDYDDLTLTTAP